MFKLLSQWRDNGAAVPFTLRELGEHTGLGIVRAPSMLDTLLGNAITAHWFSEPVSADAILPRQLVLLTLTSLLRIKTEWESQAELNERATAAAQAGYGAMASAARRAAARGPYAQ